MESLPIEIQNIIFSCLTLSDARLIYKRLTTSFNPKFISKMHKITDQHKVNYMNSGNYIIFQKVRDDRCIEYIYTNNINDVELYKGVQIDLMSRYNILRERDIYKICYAKQTILYRLKAQKLWIYNPNVHYISSLHIYLTTNAYMMGLIDELNTHENIFMFLSSELKQVQSQNILLYKRIEEYIMNLP